MFKNRLCGTATTFIYARQIEIMQDVLNIWNILFKSRENLVDQNERPETEAIKYMITFLHYENIRY